MVGGMSTKVIGDKDHVIGMVNVKEFFTEMITNKNQSTKTIEPYIRPIIRVIDSIPIHNLLLKKQQLQILINTIKNKKRKNRVF